MNYSGIKTFSIENGTGVRVSLFVSGCRHHCKGCFNEETWDFNHGDLFTKEVEDQIVESMKPDYMAGITLLGGDPAEPENQAALVPLLRRIRQELPGKTVWMYTGYVLEDFKPGNCAHCEVTEDFLHCCDVVVDGPFIMEKKNLSIKFRGSENQRIIDMQKTIETGSIVLHME